LNWIRKVIATFGAGTDLQSKSTPVATTAPAGSDPEYTDNGCDPFGYKTAWIAVKSDDPTSILDFLKVTDLHSVDWNKGIAASYDRSSRRVAVTPALNGWVVIVGSVMLEWLPLKRRDGFDSPKSILRQLSEHFGEAQFFGTHRVTEAHAWASWRRGELSRYFYCDGSQGQQFGGDDPAWAIDEGMAVGIDEDGVMEVAAAWSVNPQNVSEILAGQKSVLVTVCRLP
jgi:hypothetical protein